MKKLLPLIMLLLSSAFSAHALEATKAKTFTGHLMLWYDNGKLGWVQMLTQGHNAVFNVLNDQFEITESFTIQGVMQEDEDRRLISKVDYIYSSGFDLDAICLTKGVFTTDGKWCIIVADYNTQKHYLYNSEGKNLGVLPDNGISEPGDLYFDKVTNGKAYYVTNSYSDMNNDEYIIWSFTSGNPGDVGVSSIVAEPMAVMAYPNPLPAGEQLTVELEEPADQGTFITITDMNGRQVLRRNLCAGETSVKLSPRFAHGMHIYTVVYSDGTCTSGKLAAE